VSGNNSVNTTILNGLLTVDGSESATTLTVTATSTFDGSKSGTATVTVTAAPPAPVYSISLDASGTHTFPAVTAGYGAQTAKTVTVTNTGNQATGALTIGLSGDTSAFDLSKTSIADIANGANDTFTVKPNTGLAAGTYTATVTVSGGNITSQSFNVSFTVNPAPATLYTITFDANGGTVNPTSAQTGADGKLTTLPTPAHSGSYSFDGWFTASSGGTQVTTATVFAANATIYAQWTYTGGGGYAPPSTTTPPDEAITPTPPPLSEFPGGGTVETPPDNPPIDNGDGTTTLPGGGTIETPGGATVDVPGGTVIGGDGKVTVGSGGATIHLPGGSTFGIDEGSVIIFDEDTPLGYYIGFDNPFTDVKEGAWYYDDVAFVYTHGLFAGTSATTFSPEMAMTRGMLVTVLYRLYGAAAGSSNNPFSDVPSGQYYTDAVLWAAANGIVEGYNGKFNPNDPITRQDMAVVLARYADFAGAKLPETRSYVPFRDDADVADYAKEAIEAMFRAMIIRGKPGDLVDPQGNATRAEVAAMLHRFIETAE
jgi:hypothetical protein